MIDHVWNGSEHTTTLGIPCVLIEAVADGTDHTGAPVRRRLPMALHPYSRVGKGYRSDNVVFLDQIKEVAEHVGSEAIFVLDRGFDGGRFFEGMDRLNIDWAVRLRIKVRKGTATGPEGVDGPDGPNGPNGPSGPEEDDAYPTTGTDETRQLGIADREIAAGGRHLIDEAGVQKSAREHAHDAPRRCGWTDRWAKSGDPKRVEVRAKIVFLPGKSGTVDPTARTLIAVFTEGYPTPLVLLTSRALTDKAEIQRFAHAYFDRWNAETMIRQSKNRSGWGLSFEDTRVLDGRSIQRMALLVAALQTFLSELQTAGTLTMQPLTDRAPTTARDPEDWRYRLQHGLASYMTAQLHEVELRRRRARGGSADVAPPRFWMEFPSYRERRPSIAGTRLRTALRRGPGISPRG